MTNFEDRKETFEILRDIVCLLIVIIRSEWLLILFWPVSIGWAYYALVSNYAQNGQQKVR